MDNLATHTGGALYETYPAKKANGIVDRFEFIYTSKHGSWLNMAEIELNGLKDQCLNRRINNMKTKADEVGAWCTHRKNKRAEINWQFTNHYARIKLKGLYPTIVG